jgi:glycosyltransferase involved in cell wall biosynthesis
MANTVATPAVSIILPVYNASRYLERAVVSMLTQTFTDFELLLMDDGSTDDSLAILRKLAKADARCIVHTRENRGLVQTLNEGIARSRAEILVRMDADDLSYPRRIELQVAYLEQHPNCVAVGTEAMMIDPDGHHLCRYGVPSDHMDIDAKHMIGAGGMILHPTVALRKSAVLSIGCYRDLCRHAEDFDLFLRLAEIGGLANLPDVLVEYRQHMQSIGYSKAAAQRNAKELALIEARSRRGLAKKDAISTAGSFVGPAKTAEVHRQWAWWALSGGNIATARRHAFSSIRLSPFATDNLRLIVCVLRGF